MTPCQTPWVVALDYAQARDALQLADRLDPALCRLKVGKELFTRAGPDLVKQLHQRQFEVFLDLKFHDIPQTVASAVHAAADWGVWMVNVHASGGRRMMTAAAERLQQSGHRTLLTAVTVLTSLEAADLAEVGWSEGPEVQVPRLARLAADCGLHGVVCSAQEAASLRSWCAPDFALVTPGIRPATAPSDDQRRIMTPAQARAAGATYLVVGRPVTQAPDPVLALSQLQHSLEVSA